MIRSLKREWMTASSGVAILRRYSATQGGDRLETGVGRLIRDRGDHGVLVICDPRMVNKPYGATFIKSLPAIPRTRSWRCWGISSSSRRSPGGDRVCPGAAGQAPQNFEKLLALSACRLCN
ncbi:hypothetical protein H2136_21785 [Aeromonas hydrophila]|uniref:ATP-dependent helicase C-terminal domain-containing protein n=1 Tax=Aeromonas hydrophila TaxID=644 RepID=A0A926FPB5_AERHY|nr:hypothetical protein [Aeromonas hydrophila]